MKKLMTAGFFALLVSVASFVFSSSAFAALDCVSLENSRKAMSDSIPYDWPIALYSTGSDVNVRSGPVVDQGEILDSLQAGDWVYAEEFTKEHYNGYPWAKVITEGGVRGYVNARYLGLTKDAMTRKERFEAAFRSSVFFDFDSLVGSYENIHGNGFGDLEATDRKFAGAEFKIAVGEYDMWAYCSRDLGESEGLNIRMWGASVVSSKQPAAGLRIGQKMDDRELVQFHRDMESIGWHATPGKNGLYWYRNREYPGELPDSKGFGFSCSNGVIDGIYWCNYPADN